MKRLRFFSTYILLGLWLCCPVEAGAEERLIAVVMANSQPRYQEIHAVFEDHVASVSGDDCRIYIQTPNADIMSLRNSVRKAVALGADLIVTYGPLATLAARAEVPPMPTLFADVYDPVGLEIVSAETMTGRNMTGVRGDAPVQALFKYFVETTGAENLAVLYDVHSPEGVLQKETLGDMAARRGVGIVSLAVENPNDHMTPLKQLPDNVDGILLASSEHNEFQLSQVIEYLDEHQVPIITERAGAAEMGAFMTLETSIEEQGRVLAEMTGKVLAGEKTANLRMHTPHDVAFVINLKVARSYGIEVPIQTLSMASRVVH